MRPFVAALAAALMPCAASAQELELSFGGLLASDYISDGESLSDGKPVVQAYAEIQRGLLFAGAWASTVDHGTDSLEVELSFGIRPEFGDLELSLAYARTFYDESGDCCGELILYAEHPISETIYAGVELSYDPESSDLWFEVVNGIALSDAWSASGGIGTDFGTSDDLDDTISWNVGLVHQFTDSLYGDVRYYDSTIGSAKLVVAIGFDF